VKRDLRLWNRYVRQLGNAIDRAQQLPGYDRNKFKWAGWDCWVNGYRAGLKSGKAQAAKKRAAQRRGV
jgi:hypothetical protein